jgi:hypothetical protein
MAASQRIGGSSGSNNKMGTKKRRRRDEPFWLTLLKVGCSLALLSAATLGVLISYQGRNYDAVLSLVMDKTNTEQRTTTTDNIDFSLDVLLHTGLLTEEDSQAERFSTEQLLVPVSEEGASANVPKRLQRALDSLRSNFLKHYTKSASIQEGTELVQRYGIVAGNVFPRRSDKKHLSIWITGSSASAGYGNRYTESYAHVLQNLVAPIASSIDWRVHIHHTAMKEMTEFPMTLCVAANDDHEHDLIVYDFGEELSVPHPSRMEAFLRLVIARQRTKPTILFRGVRSRDHLHVLRHYRDRIHAVIVRDAAAMSIDDANDWSFRYRDGFREFGEFSVPGPDALHNHNLSVKQHEWTAHLIALYIGKVLELSLASEYSEANIEPIGLPSTLHLQNDNFLRSLLGESLSPFKLHCKTSYELSTMKVHGSNPVTLRRESDDATDSHLCDILVSGLAVPENDLSLELLLLPPAMQSYNRGWVLALDSESRRSKLRLKGDDRFLGYRDWKASYYGVPQSGALEVAIPVTTDPLSLNQTASDRLDALLVCESSEIVPTDSCRLYRDATLSINGDAATSTQLNSNTVATLSGKRPCVSVTVPQSARLVVVDEQKNSIGIKLKIVVSNPSITWKNGPCSLAHVIWTTR